MMSGPGGTRTRCLIIANDAFNQVNFGPQIKNPATVRGNSNHEQILFTPTIAKRIGCLVKLLNSHEFFYSCICWKHSHAESKKFPAHHAAHSCAACIMQYMVNGLYCQYLNHPVWLVHGNTHIYCQYTFRSRDCPTDREPGIRSCPAWIFSY